MKIHFIVLPILFCGLSCAGQTGNLSDWPKLLDKNNCTAAKNLCQPFANSKDIAQQVEAQKCLANAALCGHGMTMLERDDAGGGTMRDSYSAESVDEALGHLDIGLKLAPQDISIHKGRLHLLEMSGRYSAMVKTLDETCGIYKGSDAPDTWLAYSSELTDLRQYEAGLDFMKVLDKHYPNNPDIVGNIGAILSYLKKDSEAISYLQKAVQLAPNDPINAWDLGRIYDYAGQIDLANKWYQKGLSLETDPDQLKESSCIYAEFVEKKLHDPARACTLEKKDCSSEKQTACAPTPQS
jgi:tetratricopeptide (TPR) repeat protein